MIRLSSFKISWDVEIEKRRFNLLQLLIKSTISYGKQTSWKPWFESWSWFFPSSSVICTSSWQFTILRIFNFDKPFMIEVEKTNFNFLHPPIWSSSSFRRLRKCLGPLHIYPNSGRRHKSNNVNPEVTGSPSVGSPSRWKTLSTWVFFTVSDPNFSINIASSCKTILNIKFHVDAYLMKILKAMYLASGKIILYVYIMCVCIIWKQP